MRMKMQLVKMLPKMKRINTGSWLEMGDWEANGLDLLSAFAAAVWVVEIVFGNFVVELYWSIARIKPDTWMYHTIASMMWLFLTHTVRISWSLENVENYWSVMWWNSMRHLVSQLIMFTWLNTSKPIWRILILVRINECWNYLWYCYSPPCSP